MSELTGRSKDEALTALHDCDYDANRAVEILLERQDDQVCVAYGVSELTIAYNPAVVATFLFFVRFFITIFSYSMYR